jgi:hypothetical protein
LSATLAATTAEGLPPFACGIGIVAETSGPALGSGFVFGVWLAFFAPFPGSFASPLALGRPPPALCGAVVRPSVTSGAGVAPSLALPLVPGLPELPVEVGAGVVVALGVFEPELAGAFELEFDPPVVAAPLAAFGSEFVVPAGGAFATAGAGCCGGDGGVVGVVVVAGGIGAIGAVASRRAAKGWEAALWLVVDACRRWVDAKDGAALTSDAILGTVKPLPSRCGKGLPATPGPARRQRQLS